MDPVTLLYPLMHLVTTVSTLVVNRSGSVRNQAAQQQLQSELEAQRLKHQTKMQQLSLEHSDHMQRRTFREKYLNSQGVKYYDQGHWLESMGKQYAGPKPVVVFSSKLSHGTQPMHHRIPLDPMASLFRAFKQQSDGFVQALETRLAFSLESAYQFYEEELKFIPSILVFGELVGNELAFYAIWGALTDEQLVMHGDRIRDVTNSDMVLATFRMSYLEQHLAQQSGRENLDLILDFVVNSSLQLLIDYYYLGKPELPYPTKTYLAMDGKAKVLRSLGMLPAELDAGLMEYQTLITRQRKLIMEKKQQDLDEENARKQVREILASKFESLEEAVKSVKGSSPNPSKSNDGTMDMVLNKVSHGREPRIAILGETSSGKSTLINKLFGHPILETKSTPDTTTMVHEIKFGSGLVLYDTPGFESWNPETENRTRAFMGLGLRRSDQKSSQIPMVVDGKVVNVDAKTLRKEKPIDLVLFLMNISITPKRRDGEFLTQMIDQISKKGKTLIVVGTHYDELLKKPHQEVEEMLGKWRQIVNGKDGHREFLPVSSITGEGLKELVLAFFRRISDDVSFSKLQAALTTEQRLGRLSFIIEQVSQVLSEIAFLKGNNGEELLSAIYGIYALVSSHYDVSEVDWDALDGDFQRIRDHVAEFGKQVKSEQKERTVEVQKQKGFWQKVRSFVRAMIKPIETYTEYVTKYRTIGYPGLELLLPMTASILTEFEYEEELNREEFDRHVQERRRDMHGEILSQNPQELGSIVASVLRKGVVRV